MAYMIHKKMKARKQAAEEQDDDLARLVDKRATFTLNDGQFSEVISLFCTSEHKSVKVHKCILAQSSPVFAIMFSKAGAKQKIVEIVDVKYEVLVEMIRFIYAGKVRNIDALAGELAVAANAYALGGLKIMCEKTMTKNLNLSNVIVCLQLADRLCMAQLRKKAIEFGVENADNVSVKPEFKTLPGNILSELFRCLANKIR